MQNARFWVYINGTWSKITLTQERRNLHHHKGWDHDEGWSSEFHQWKLDDDFVTEYICDDGCDCDGRLTRCSDWICRVEDLHKSPREDGAIMTPRWIEEGAYQTDQYAEMAGY